MSLQTSTNPKTTVVIQIGGENGPTSYEVQGETVGSGVWAATRTVTYRNGALEYGNTWRITHVPTGRAAFPPIWSKSVARAIAEKLVDLGLDRANQENDDKLYLKMMQILGDDYPGFFKEVGRWIDLGRSDEREFREWLAEWKPSRRSARAAKKPPPTHERPAAKRKPAKPKAPAAKAKAAKPTAARGSGLV